MKLKESLEKLYKQLTTDEELLRLLHYVPKNALDNPLDKAKQDVLSKTNKYDIISKVLTPSDKTYDLVLDSKMSRICFYTGTRKPQTSYSGSSRRLQDNPYASDQIYNFDVYVHVDIDIVDFRMTWICDRINELLLLNSITDVGDFILAFSSPINNTPKGFIGYKLAYTTTSLQEAPKRTHT
ncbi:hypothetical protein ACQKNX_08200 [Lysinibacillus sp. NPDC093712]|uniref:hypothetical protein n=1 Tax=Lysinibacillus sp. NPDC093712 TaxID=3390579 RepID=UPI003D004FB1